MALFELFGVRRSPATGHLPGSIKRERCRTDRIARAASAALALSIALSLLLLLTGCGSDGDVKQPVITVVVERVVVVTSEPTPVPPAANAEALAATRTPRPRRTKTPTPTSDPRRITGPTRTPRPTLTARPSPTRVSTRTPTPDLPSIVAAMSVVVGGEGVPEAAIYDVGAPGPHRLVILESSGAAHSWVAHHWNDDALVIWWRPWTVNETELVVVVEERKVSLESQRYMGAGPRTIHRYRLDLDVQVRSARTGEVLLTTTLAGPEPGPFPYRIDAGTREILGKPVPYEDLEDWLACQVGLGACLRPMRRLEGHTGGVECVAYSPDGQMLASGSEDATVRLWRLSDGATLRVLEGPADDVDAVAFSPDGQTLASSSRDGTVHLWSVSDGAPLYVLEVDDSPTSISLSFAPNGQTLATGSDDDTVRFWRVSDGSLLATLEGHTKGVSSVAFSPDGQTLASGSYDDTVRLWRLSDGALLNTLAGHDESVASVAFSPDGLILATGSWDDTVRLWEVRSGSLLYTYKEHTDTVRRVLFSPDGQTIVSYDNTVHLWRVSDGAVLRKLRFRDAAHGVVDIAFSPDWQMLALAQSVSAVQIYQIDGLPWE